MLTEKELGERLKNIREVRRISQFRLGEMVECGQGHIGKLEKGEHYPKLPTLYKISESLNISVSDILAESPPSKDGMLSPEEVGANIRKWRTMRGLGVKKLAEKSGVSRNSIRNLETGKCMSFLLTYQYIAEALGVTVGTLQAKESGGQSLNLQSTVRTGMIVRRLTPMECERLQGYPDGWTDIGEWRDSKGKLRDSADSPRYKACGNSIALPFWDFLAKRISAQYLRPVTMGSLFDGIGGFPLVFERHNGKGTARWASEIEEFPIAVTKLRFGEE